MEQKHYIIEFVEIQNPVMDFDSGITSHSGSETFLVSTRKIEEFVKEHDFEYGYVEHLVKGALAQHAKGLVPKLSTGAKYSFTDGGEDWYSELQPDDCNDEKIEVTVELG